MKTITPQPFNGLTFRKELQAQGIAIPKFYIDGEGKLVLDVPAKDEAKIQAVLDSHDGSDTIPPEQALKDSAMAKLTALGLSADEVRAIVG